MSTAVLGDRDVPEVLARLLSLAACLVLGVSLVALPAAMLGVFHPLVVFPLGLAASAVLAWVCESGGTRDRLPVAPTLAVLLLVGVVGVANGRYHSQHMLTTRDPGVYTVHAKSLAKTHDLVIKPTSPAIVADSAITYAQQGIRFSYGTEKLDGQFLHLATAMFAIGEWVGGDQLLFAINALYGSLALLFIYAFATRLVRPWIAVAVTAAMTVNLVQIHFTRDTYSEPLTQLFVFAALWMLSVARERFDSRRAGVAGLLMGASMMARIDSWVFFTPLAMYALYEVAALRAERDVAQGRARRNFIAWFAAGVTVPFAISVVDGYVFAAWYLSDLGGRIDQLHLLAVLSVAAIAVYWFARPRFDRPAEALRRRREALSVVAGVGLVVVIGLLWFVRPEVQTTKGDPIHLVGGLQARDGTDVDPTRQYSEEAFERLGWYVGPVAIAAGFAGVALLSVRAIRGAPSAPGTVAFLLLFGAVTALYVWEISITPDHVWAMRRFLPVTIPGLLLGVGVAVEWLFGRGRIGLAAAGTALLLVAVACPANTTRPVWRKDRSEVGMLGVVEEACRRLPKDAAVVVVGSESHLDITLPHAIRTWCDVPTAAAKNRIEAARLPEYRAAAAKAGKRLYFLSDVVDPVAPRDPARQMELVADIDLAILEMTIARRPEKMESSRFTLFLSPA